jgi:hypothetical protein
MKERAGGRFTGSVHAARRDLDGHANHIKQRCVRFKAAFASCFVNGFALPRAAHLSEDRGPGTGDWGLGTGDIRQDDDASISNLGSSSSLHLPISVIEIGNQIRPGLTMQHTIAKRERVWIYIAFMAIFSNGAVAAYRFEQFMGHARYGTVSHCKVSGWSLRTARIRLRCARLLSRIPLGVQFHDFLLSVAADAAAIGSKQRYFRSRR